MGIKKMSGFYLNGKNKKKFSFAFSIRANLRRKVCENLFDIGIIMESVLVKANKAYNIKPVSCFSRLSPHIYRFGSEADKDYRNRLYQ